jgi:branched-chain amino acid transport system ATP-binding protein
MTEPILVVSGLHAGYGGTEILHGVDLAVGHAEIVAILGSNGAGKSTLNRTISGLLRPSRGSIIFANVPIERAQPASIVSRGLIHVPEGRRIFPNLTVRENLDLGSYRRARARRAGNRRRVCALFPRLAERQSQLAGTLSGGEQQMLAIGRALLTKPRLLMLDEPTEGIQPSIILEIEEALRRIKRELGLAILLVEQYLDFAERLADKYVIMAKGAVVASGATRDLRVEMVRQHLAV